MVGQDATEKAVENLCASFDLQQGIHLPITKESAVFYKRRLGVYNFTFYNIATREVFCYTWDESQSKRGASEISTALYFALKHYDAEGVNILTYFLTGVPDRIRTTIPTMLLYFLAKSTSSEAVSLRYFEPYHGQNEGDACAIQKAGDIMVPSQLHPIFRLARRGNPYKVVPLQSQDFLDFKQLSKDLRILKEREIEGSTDFVLDWTQMAEIKI